MRAVASAYARPRREKLAAQSEPELVIPGLYANRRASEFAWDQQAKKPVMTRRFEEEREREGS